MVARHIFLALVAALAFGWTHSPTLADPPEPIQKKDRPGKTEPGDQGVDRYAVPDGDVGVLLEFLEGLSSFRPRTNAEFIERSKRLVGARKQAAERILELEKNVQSEAARIAVAILLDIRLQGLPDANPDEQRATYDEVKRFLMSIDVPMENELELAWKTANKLERIGNDRLAIEANRTFGDLFAEQEEELMARYGERMRGIARRLDLPGKEMQITGATFDGEPFDWAAYRGKVVLVDFWATWCAPCVTELPNVKRYFDQYHKQGFDVVGISLDTNRGRLAEFIENRELPWVTLFEDRIGRQHPMAAFYGVTKVPTVILVDQQGKVVSMDAHGRELGRQLESLLGPPPE